jgi:hypothetical protein
MSSRAPGLLILIACAHAAPQVPPKVPVAGVSIAIYARGDSGYAVIDDRRWIDTDGRSIELPRIDPGAALASLVIEPLAGALQIGRCTRERVPVLPPKADPKARRPPPPPVERFAPVVRCAATGAPGRYLVRVLYVSATLTYRAEHDVAMVAADRASVVSRFAVATSAWQERAEVVLYDGVPGGEHPPRAVAHGELELDGSTAVLADRPRDVAARLRRVYDGALPSPGIATSDLMWGRESGSAVWVWLELPRLRLAPGLLRVYLALADEGTRDIDVPANARQQADDADAPLRLPLWVDDRLHGLRQRSNDFSAGAALAERVLLSVANLGDTPRDVWIEERLRPARRRSLERAWPSKLAATGDAVRTKVVIAPGKVEHVGFTVAYEF